MSENTQVALLLIGLLTLIPAIVGMFLWMLRDQRREHDRIVQLLLTRIQAPEQGIALAHPPAAEPVEDMVSAHFGPFPDLSAEITS